MPETSFDAEREFLPHNLIAAQEIADAEAQWSAARALGGQPYDGAGLTPQQRIARLSVRSAFYELIEQQGASPDEADTILQLFAENPHAANATLGRINMRGEWDAADGFERSLFNLMWLLYDAKYKSIHWVSRESKEAKRSVTIPAGLTTQYGFVALRRKRRLVVANHTAGARARRPQIEIDKVSTFALDIKKLGQLDSNAVAEVRLIVAATMFKAVDWAALEYASEASPDDVKSMFDHLLDATRLVVTKEQPGLQAALEDLRNLTDAMRRNNLSFDEVRHRAYGVEDFARLRDPRGERFIEDALHERSNLLTPAATTYYVHS